MVSLGLVPNNTYASYGLYGNSIYYFEAVHSLNLVRPYVHNNGLEEVQDGEIYSGSNVNFLDNYMFVTNIVIYMDSNNVQGLLVQENKNDDVDVIHDLVQAEAISFMENVMERRNYNDNFCYVVDGDEIVVFV